MSFLGTNRLFGSFVYCLLDYLSESLRPEPISNARGERRWLHNESMMTITDDENAFEPCVVIYYFILDVLAQFDPPVCCCGWSALLLSLIDLRK